MTASDPANSLYCLAVLLTIIPLELWRLALCSQIVRLMCTHTHMHTQNLNSWLLIFWKSCCFSVRQTLQHFAGQVVMALGLVEHFLFYFKWLFPRGTCLTLHFLSLFFACLFEYTNLVHLSPISLPYIFKYVCFPLSLLRCHCSLFSIVFLVDFLV